MDPAHFRILNNELFNKNPYVFSEQSIYIILNIKLAMCMAKNGKDTKHTRHFSIIVHFVINCDDFNVQNTVWC